MVLSLRGGFTTRQSHEIASDVLAMTKCTLSTCTLTNSFYSATLQVEYKTVLFNEFQGLGESYIPEFSPVTNFS